MAPIPEPGTLGFVGLDAGGAAVSDLKLFGWLKHLQSEVPFPQPSYGRVEPPATPAELIERLADAHRALEEAVALAASGTAADVRRAVGPVPGATIEAAAAR